MKEFVCRIADLYIKIICKYDYTYNMCLKYIIDSYDHIDIITDPESYSYFDKNYNEEINEFMNICRYISNNLYKFNRILLHGASISYNNNGYLFVAPSGVGKSTHIKLLRDNYKGIDIINGDKPILDSFGYIHGTPWAGKENWSLNVKYKLKSIIFLKRDTYNHYSKLNSVESIISLLDESYKDTGIDNAIDILNNALKEVSFYELYCTNSKEAADLSFNNIISLSK